jgi:hypothetical protein
MWTLPASKKFALRADLHDRSARKAFIINT